MNGVSSQVIHGDCLKELARLDVSSVDLVYLDPPFFSKKQHSAVTRDRTKRFSFGDIWSGLGEYLQFLEPRLRQVHRILKDTGSVFLHCDSSANFMLRALLNDIFGEENFRSEIIWTYRRWSNSANGLMPAHQTIYFYSKSARYKFNRIHGAYSETTNVDQILQLRSRDEDNISSYATDDDGKVVFGGEKKGVPLSDVWEIPFLNPKARERSGYPTQKPVLLLERVIEICTDPNDLVVDPFCGSGTTLVAALILGRRSIGMDNSKDAAELARSRIEQPMKTESALLQRGRASYANADADALSLLRGLALVPVQRNAGIDAFLKTSTGGSPIAIRVQRDTETLAEAASSLWRAIKSKHILRAFLVRTQLDDRQLDAISLPQPIEVIDATAVQVTQRISELTTQEGKEEPTSGVLHADVKQTARRM